MRVNLVDIHTQSIYEAELIFSDTILSIEKLSTKPNPSLPYALPGFVDAHVHVESSMLIPTEFARMAVVHGTVATISDPHEIANVCGVEGVQYMIDNAQKTPFKFYFGAPSCVPATFFETAGASIDSHQIDFLLAKPEIKYLAEMMNFPGVLSKDEEVMKKINIAKKWKKPIDGHAPGLRGELAKSYIDAGISTDHECFTRAEAEEKLQYGMKILIREGSAAKNFEALIDLLHDYEDDIMFCSDDKHPDSLLLGHINNLCKRAVAKNIDLFKILKAACVNPVLHYNLEVGLLKINDSADFILVKDLIDFEVLETYIDGQLVAKQGTTLLNSVEEKVLNNFSATPITTAQLQYNATDIPLTKEGKIPVIQALDGQLITIKSFENPTLFQGAYTANVEQDILKLVVVNRYQNAPIAKGFIQNFGLKKGAIASSVAHDSHNIIAVGVDDESLCQSINVLIQSKGGLSAVADNVQKHISLPVAGLMSHKDAYVIAEEYTQIDCFVKSLGSSLQAPFMTLSFMALLVIPHLKLSDKGLFDGDTFSFIH